jgi:hypothetical protein
MYCILAHGPHFSEVQKVPLSDTILGTRNATHCKLIYEVQNENRLLYTPCKVDSVQS